MSHQSTEIPTSQNSPTSSELIETLCRAISNADLGNFTITLEQYLECIDFNARNLEGATLLHWSIIENQPLIAATLLQYDKCDVNVPDDDGNSPLQVAVCHSRSDIVGMLLKHQDIDLNHTDSEQNSALFDACMNGSCDIIRMLVEAGADFNMRNAMGQRPKDVCADSNTIQCLASCTARKTTSVQAPISARSGASSTTSSSTTGWTFGKSMISSSAPAAGGLFGRKRASPLTSTSDDAMRKALLLSRRPQPDDSPKKRRRYSCSSLKLNSVKQSNNTEDNASVYSSAASIETFNSGDHHMLPMDWSESHITTSDADSLEGDDGMESPSSAFRMPARTPKKEPPILSNVGQELQHLRLDNEQLRSENTLLKKDLALEREKVRRLEVELQNRALTKEIMQMRRENLAMKEQNCADDVC